ncbi:hypothetical protein RR48_02037 [Papilio machaon]|uniref:Uncharacterized protein n=1 Tax=Papilio machaon TaxID=76193 RepID=A0A0N0PEV9_PAPMA|nr:hypothetical protein RR48_02037 [Papilio machaon]
MQCTAPVCVTSSASCLTLAQCGASVADPVGVLVSVWCSAVCQQVPAPAAPAAPASSTESEEPPEGYYAFVESPNATPPSELIRNETLRFLSRTLPVLRADDALPRVAHVPHPDTAHYPTDTAHYPTDTAHYPADSAHYPADSAHSPTDSAHYPTTGARYPADLPQVAEINGNRLEERSRRSLETGAGAGAGALPAEHRGAEAEAPRESRKFCDGGGV